MAQKPKSQSINQNFDSLLKEKPKSQSISQNYDTFGGQTHTQTNKNKSKCVQRTLVAPLTVFYFSKYTKSLPHETMNDIEWPCTMEIQSFLYQMPKSKSLWVMAQRKTLTWRFHLIKYKFFPFLGGKGGSDQTDTSLRGGAESHRETFDQLRKPYARNFVSYRVSRKKLKKYTSFFHFLGERGGPIKQTLLSGGVQNPPSKQLTNFEILKIKTRGVMTQRETLTWRFHGIKYKFFPLLRGKGGSDQTDTTLREGAESHRETFDQLWKPYVRNLVSYRVSRKKYTSFSTFWGEGGVRSNWH